MTERKRISHYAPRTGRLLKEDDTIVNEADLLEAIADALTGESAGGGEVAVVSSALPEGAATEAKQDTLIAKDFATQTTLAAILAKLIAAPATEATVEAIRLLLAGVLSVTIPDGKATQAVVIAVDADIPATSGITANVDTDATVLFAGDAVPVAVKLLAGVVYPYSIVKVTVGDDIVGLY